MNQNELTHPDRIGQSRLYLLIVAAIVTAALTLASCSPQTAQNAVPEQPATAAAVVVPTDTAIPTNTPAPTATPTLVPTPTLDPCPMQPERWTFNLQKDASGNVYRNNYRMLTPTCAYDNLLPWLAYAMMLQNG